MTRLATLLALAAACALPAAALAQAPASAAPQIAFPGQYAAAPAEWKYPVWPSGCRRFAGEERMSCLEFVASDYGRLSRYAAAESIRNKTDRSNRLADLAATLGPRAAAICRELTKLHEEVRYENLDVLAQLYANGAETRGEFVVVIAPPVEEQGADDIDVLLKRALSRVSVKDAVGEVAVATGRPRREIYQRALALTKDDKNGAG